MKGKILPLPLPSQTKRKMLVFGRELDYFPGEGGGALDKAKLIERAKLAPRGRVHTIRFEGWSDSEITLGLAYIGPLGGWNAVTSLQIGEKVSGPVDGTALQRVHAKFPRITRFLSMLAKDLIPPLPGWMNYQSIAHYWFPNISSLRITADDTPLAMGMRLRLTSLCVDLIPGGGTYEQIASCANLQELYIRVPGGGGGGGATVNDESMARTLTSGGATAAHPFPKSLRKLLIFGGNIYGSIDGLVRALPNLEELEIRSEWDVQDLDTWGQSVDALADHRTLRSIDIWLVTVHFHPFPNTPILTVMTARDEFRMRTQRLLHRPSLQLKYELRLPHDNLLSYFYVGKRCGYAPSPFRPQAVSLYKFGGPIAIGKTVFDVSEQCKQHGATRFDFTMRVETQAPGGVPPPDPYEGLMELPQDESVIRAVRYSPRIHALLLEKLKDSEYREVRLHLVAWTHDTLRHLLSCIARIPKLEQVELIIHAKANKTKEYILNGCREDIRTCLLDRRTIRRFSAVHTDGSDIRTIPELMNDHDESLELSRCLFAFAAGKHHRLGSTSQVSRLPRELMIHVGHMFSREE